MRISELGLLNEEETWIDGKRQSVSNASEARKKDKYYGVSVEQWQNEEDEIWEVVGNESGFVYLQTFDKLEAYEKRKEMILSFYDEIAEGDSPGEGLGGDEPYRGWD